MARHAASLSIFQTVALACTGIIWSRYSLVIIPKNWSLFSVNAFVALTQLIQLGRAMHYHYYGDETDLNPTNATMVEFSTIAPDLNSTLDSLTANFTENVI